MINQLFKKVKLLASSGKKKFKNLYIKNKKNIYKFFGKTFITIIKIIVE